MLFFLAIVRNKQRGEEERGGRRPVVYALVSISVSVRIIHIVIMGFSQMMVHAVLGGLLTAVQLDSAPPLQIRSCGVVELANLSLFCLCRSTSIFR